MNVPKEPFFQALFNTPIPRIILKANPPDFTILAYNKAFETATGLADRSILDQSIWTAVNPDKSDEESMESFRAALIQVTGQSKQTVLKKFKYCLPASNRKLEPHWWEIEIIPVGSHADSPDFLLVSTHNITTREKLTIANTALARTQEKLVDLVRQLQISESRAKHLISDAPVAIGVLSGKNMIVESANRKLLEIWGKNQTILGLSITEALPEIIGQPYIEILKNVYESGMPYYGNEKKAILEYKGELKEIYLNFVYHPLFSQGDQTNEIMVVAVNVTEQVLSRKSIERAEEMLRLAINSASLGTWYMDAQTREFTPSARTKVFFGFHPDEEMTFESSLLQIDEPYRHLVREAVELAIVNGENFDVEHPVTGLHDGRKRWLKSTGRLYPAVQDKPANFSGTILDITERKEDEQRKNDFISMVSHELKTPLTSLTAYLQLLLHREKQQENQFTINALSRANQQVKKMAAMINGFLNVSRLGSGKIYLTPKRFDLSDLVEEVISEMLVINTTHPFIFEAGEPMEVYADRDKIGQVISNFLSNSIKYSFNGKKVEISCYTVKNKAILQVKDEGIGIAAHDQHKLFERFYRVENKHTANISGFGIGLYLCAEIIQRHSGEIWVESTIGEGSIFYFSLPLSGNRL